ncbi:MAG: hypothetical protein RLZZ628_406 [Bacteroidota bacterium]|jgi:hypothetical protein
MEAILKIFEHNNSLAWVIGAIMTIAVALISRNTNLFSENKTFFIVLLAIVLVSSMHLVNIFFPNQPVLKNGLTQKGEIPVKADSPTVTTVNPNKPQTPSNGGNHHPKPAGNDRKANQPPPKDPVYMPVIQTNAFVGTWKNTNPNSNNCKKLVFVIDGADTRVQITSRDSAEVGNFITVAKSPKELFLKQFTYGANKYDNVKFTIQPDGILNMAYHATVTDGRQFDINDDQFSKQLR